MIKLSDYDKLVTTSVNEEFDGGVQGSTKKMKRRGDIDGQIDLFDILRSYTDDVGATVIIGDPKQLLDDQEDNMPFEEEIQRVGRKKKKEHDRMPKLDEAPLLEIIKESQEESKQTLLQKAEELTESTELEEPIEESEELTQKGSIKESEELTQKGPTKGSEELKQEEPVIKSDVEIITAVEQIKETQDIRKTKEKLFKQCSKCWCFDCIHNVSNEGKPRNMCGTMMACPACKGCEESGIPEICQIGSAKEGCMTRAIEEGIVVPMDMEENI